MNSKLAWAIVRCLTMTLVLILLKYMDGIGIIGFILVGLLGFVWGATP